MLHYYEKYIIGLVIVLQTIGGLSTQSLKLKRNSDITYVQIKPMIATDADHQITNAQGRQQWSDVIEIKPITLPLKEDTKPDEIQDQTHAKKTDENPTTRKELESVNESSDQYFYNTTATDVSVSEPQHEDPMQRGDNNDTVKLNVTKTLLELDAVNNSTSFKDSPALRRVYTDRPFANRFSDLKRKKSIDFRPVVAKQYYSRNHHRNNNILEGKRYISKCRCEKIWNCPKLQITVPRCPNEYFLCCF